MHSMTYTVVCGTVARSTQEIGGSTNAGIPPGVCAGRHVLLHGCYLREATFVSR